MTGPGKTDEQRARAARLSAALRENLRRRKAQSRARTGEPALAAGRPTGSASDPAPATAVHRSPENGPLSHDSAGIVPENGRR
ncbi:hypothetical protein CH340_10800 [Rhodoplanes serenus]|nr:hypothetical protein CH340_10800 [Rhodoplanes serenus]